MVDQPAGIFFHMDSGDTNALEFAIDPEQNVSIPADRPVILGDLITLGQVGVTVILAVEFAKIRNLTVESESGHDDVIDRLLIDDRQDTWIPHTNGTNACVRRRAGVVRAAGTKH